MDERKIFRFEFPVLFERDRYISICSLSICFVRNYSGWQSLQLRQFSQLFGIKSDRRSDSRQILLRFCCGSKPHRRSGAMRRMEKLLEKFNFELVKEILFLWKNQFSSDIILLSLTRKHSKNSNHCINNCLELNRWIDGMKIRGGDRKRKKIGRNGEEWRNFCSKNLTLNWEKYYFYERINSRPILY